MRGTTAEVLAHFQATPPRGEFTLVIGGNTGPANPPPPSPDQVRRRLDALAAQGVSTSEAARLVAAETGLPRREVYKEAISSKQ